MKKNFIILCSLLFSYKTFSLYNIKDTKEYIITSKKLNDFIEDTKNLLPPKMISHIIQSKGSIGIIFKDFKEKIEIPQCHSRNEKKNTYGNYNAKTHIITLNINLISYMDKKFAKKQRFMCGHQNMYSLAQSVLIHETAHAFDFYNDKRINESSLSSSNEFVKLANWTHKDGKTKNISPLSSPDSYEFESLSEYFAVNFEYFLLDKDFALKKPSHYLFFMKVFFDQKEIPKSIHKKITKTLPIISSKDFIKLDPSQIEKISYVYVSSGKKIESGFGHSMLRLEGCNISYNKKNSCPKNHMIDLVVSFSASIQQEVINPFKGIFGGYPSKVNISSYKEMSDRYSFLENRRLVSYKLKIDTYQKNMLIYRILEDFWSYQGNYKFIFNNCATEIRDLLQLIYHDSDFFKSRVKTPRKIIHKLKKSQLIDQSETKIKESYKNKRNQLIDKILSFKNHDFFCDFETKFFDYSISQRFSSYNLLFHRIKEEAENNTLSMKHLKLYLDFHKSLINFENLNLMYLNIQKQKELNFYLNHIFSSDTLLLNEYEKSIKDLLLKIDQNSNLKISNYGIPLTIEFSSKLKMMNKLSNLIDKASNFDMIVSTELKKLNTKIISLEKNIYSLKDQIALFFFKRLLS